jgi:hypothetical protein
MPAIPWVAPQMRLVRVSTGAEERQISARLASVSVDQVNTGVGTLDLTLVNLRHGTDEDTSLAVPTVPPYLFDALDLLAFGEHVRVDARYVGGTAADLPEEITLGPEPVQDDGYTPLMVARITGMQFAFSGVATLKITGEDLAGLLKVKPERPVPHNGLQEREIAERILQAVNAPALGTTLGSPKVTDTAFSAALGNVQQTADQTHLAFLDEMAKRLDYELFVDFDEPYDHASAVKLHFERARSQLYDSATLVDLRFGLNLISFSPTLSMWDQYTSANAVGRNPSTSATSGIVAEADVVRTDAPGESDSFQSAAEARAAVGPNVQRVTVANLDDARRQRAAEAALLEQARKFVVATAEVVGLPALRPGIHVRVTGLYPPFDGLYYVTKATHTLDASGYRTSLTVRRPGWTSPAEYARLVQPPASA